MFSTVILRDGLPSCQGWVCAGYVLTGLSRQKKTRTAGLCAGGGERGYNLPRWLVAVTRAFSGDRNAVPVMDGFSGQRRGSRSAFGRQRPGPQVIPALAGDSKPQHKVRRTA